MPGAGNRAWPIYRGRGRLMRRTRGGSEGGPFGLIVIVLFGSVCCIGIPLLLPVVASFSLGGVLLAAGVGLPLAAIVVVIGIVGARWYRSRVRPIGPGLPLAATASESEKASVSDAAAGADGATSAPTRASERPHLGSGDA